VPHNKNVIQNPDPYSRGAFVGIWDYHERKDFIRAILEGLAFEFAFTLWESEDVLGQAVGKIQAIGGGTKNQLWMEIKSAVLNMPVEVPAVQESTLLGAALLGGLGAGVYRDEHEALAETYRVLYTHEPNPELVKQYEPIYETYTEVVPLIRQIGHIVGGSEV
jgi:xylulokinase